jgi:hypothetical protein
MERTGPRQIVRLFAEVAQDRSLTRLDHRQQRDRARVGTQHHTTSDSSVGSKYTRFG